MSEDNVEKTVKQIINVYANTANVSDNDYIRHILDSIDVVDMSFDVEERLGIYLEDKTFEDLSAMTVGDFISFCKKLKS